MKLEITFKSGAQVSVDVTEFSTKRGVISNMYGELNWTTPNDWTRKLHSVDLEQVACLVAVEDE